MTITALAMHAMRRTMLRDDPSRLPFEETVAHLQQQAKTAGWKLPQELDLEELYARHGILEPSRATVVYLCDPQAGHDITRDDLFKSMFAFMPTGVCVYETSRGQVRVTRMDFGFMARLFWGEIRASLLRGGERMEAALDGILSC